MSDNEQNHIDPMASVRAERNRKLSMCDWTQLPDNELNEQQREAWALYRQELRNLLNFYDEPSDVVWPKQPD